MATILATDIAWNYANNPIIVNVTPGTVSSKAVFHQVKLKVHASFDSFSKSFVFSMPAISTSPITFDISSAIRSLTQQYVYVPITKTTIHYYPFAQFTLEAWDESLIDGVAVTSGNITNAGGSVYMGGLTEYERFMTKQSADYIINNIRRFTRKPSDMIWVKGEVGCLSSILAGQVRIDGYDVNTMDEGGNTIHNNGEDISVYVVPNDGKYIFFQFVNGLGVVENIAARPLEELEYTIESEEFGRIGTPEFNISKENKMYYKSDVHAEMKMSSGFVTREWAEWWVNEFIKSEKVWMMYRNNWMPVLIEPEDSNTIYSKSSPGMIHVDFTVKMMFGGSIMNTIY